MEINLTMLIPLTLELMNSGHLVVTNHCEGTNQKYRGVQSGSWRANVLQSSAQHTCLDVSSNPEEIDYLVQVCLIRIGAELCRIVALQEQDLKPMLFDIKNAFICS